MDETNTGPTGAPEHAVAVIGMAGRFPGADDVHDFWDNIAAGRECFTVFTPEELIEAGVDPALVADPRYVPSRPVLRDVRSFDATFFGLSPREATYTDPQQRLFTECAWEALEMAGYPVGDGRGDVGVFAGTNMSTYLFTRPRAMRLGSGDADELMAGNDKDSLATRVSYRLDLRGPSVTVQSFCSTSLVSVHLAAASLRRGECDLALAGGVSLRLPDRTGYLYQEGNQASPDGHVRTFDAQAKGSMFGDGVAAVTLKRLDQAIADRDTVLAVIRGSAINNDGGVKFSYQAPSIDGQVRCVSAALADADVDPLDVQYVEAHGTATEVGDPMEVAALATAFGNRTRALHAAGTDSTESTQGMGDPDALGSDPGFQYCLLGSVKPNVGHLDRASGVTGLIKVVQSLRHELIPGTLNFTSPNPEIDFAHSPFRVTPDATPWPRDEQRPRIAAVTSLGMGGTNVQAIVGEAPPLPVRGPHPRRWQVLPVSARYSDGADRACANLAADLRADDADRELGDVAWTLQAGRARFAHRRVVVADGIDSAVLHLDSPTGRWGRLDATIGRKVGFLLAGVGEQYPGMVADLYASDPDFRADVDACLQVLELDTAAELSSSFVPATASSDPLDLAVLLGRADQEVPDVVAEDLAQPAVFVEEYAVARHLARRGISPSVMVGYSLGEYVAACLSGVLTLSDALRLVAHRASLIAALPTGAMLAVGDETVAELHLGELWSDVDVAVRTGSQVVLAGTEETITAAAELLLSADVPCRRLVTSHAYHSRMLEPARQDLVDWARDHVTPRAPQIPYYSNVTGELATEELVTDPEYWGRHMCESVEFGAALGEMLRGHDCALVEIGPGQSLGAMVRAHPECDRDRWPLLVGSLPSQLQAVDAEQSLAETVARLWLIGVDIDWRGCHGDWQPGRVPLPTYPFDRQEYWLEEEMLSAGGGEGAGLDLDDPTGLLGDLPRLDESQLVNQLVWQQTTPRPVAEPARHLLVLALPGVHDDLVAALRARLSGTELDGATLTVAHPGDSFSVTAPDPEHDPDHLVVTLRPGVPDDVDELLVTLGKRGTGLHRVVHLWESGLADECAADEEAAAAAVSVSRGLHTLVALARAAGDRGHAEWTLDIVTSGTQAVLPADRVLPGRATLLGPARLIPVEYPQVRTRMLDVDGLGTSTERAALLSELAAERADQVVALRGGRRWIPGYEIVPPEADPAPVAGFRRGGTYLVTGGLGGIGLAMAERIARDHAANVVLLGRTPVPPADQWSAVLDDPRTSEEVRRRLLGLRRIQQGPGDVLVVAGDVAVRADTRRVVEAAVARFGDLHGVVHCAGVPAVGLMQFKATRDMDGVLAPKLAGSLALVDALRGRDLDFMVLFSSTTSATGGGAGQVDYCAANAAVDAVALSDPLPGCTVVSIGWGEWTWNGWTAGLDRYDEGSRDFLNAYREKFGVDFDAGWRLMQRIIGLGAPYAVVSTQDFPTLVRMSRTSSIASHQAQVRRIRDELGRHPRPELAVPFVAPHSHAEEVIAGLWSEALGLEEVGIQDNFFDLGGNSLVGMEIIGAIRTALGVDYLPPHLLYQAPTVSELAAAVEPRTDGVDAAPGTDSEDGAASYDGSGPARVEQQSRIELRRSSLRSRRTA